MCKEAVVESLLKNTGKSLAQNVLISNGLLSHDAPLGQGQVVSELWSLGLRCWVQILFLVQVLDIRSTSESTLGCRSRSNEYSPTFECQNNYCPNTNRRSSLSRMPETIQPRRRDMALRNSQAIRAFQFLFEDNWCLVFSLVLQ